MLPTSVVGRILGLIGGLAALASPAFAQSGYVENQVIVRLKEGRTFASASRALNSRELEVERPLVPELGLYLVRLKHGLAVQNALSQLRAHPTVRYAQPDHRLSWRSRMPNDPDFGKLWNLNIVSAPAAWELGTGGKDKSGNEVVIALVDGGLDLAHPELADNLWTNRAEIAGNGLDDDGNGYVDDVHGWNAYAHSGEIPSASHGTHVAGIAGARGNNALGVAGINWDVKIMPVAASSATTSTVAEGYGYVLAQKKLWLESRGAKGANVVATNSSFGVDYADCASGEFPVWNDLYDSLGKVGILSAAATANLGIDVDVRGDVPTGCKSTYLITVTNTDAQDQLNADAAWGAHTISLGAPGENVYSLLPVAEGSAGTKSGTSMSTPHVTGAIALLHAVASQEFSASVQRDPGAAALQIKAALLSSVDPLPSLQGKTVSGGRLNLIKAAQALGATPTLGADPVRARH